MTFRYRDDRTKKTAADAATLRSRAKGATDCRRIAVPGKTARLLYEFRKEYPSDMKAEGKKKASKTAGEIKLKAFKQAAMKLVEAIVLQISDLHDSIDMVARELKRVSDDGR